jgi:hypothetical protein
MLIDVELTLIVNPFNILKYVELSTPLLEDFAAKLIHSVSISWLPGCALRSQICDSGREDDGCKHWINEILNECWLEGNYMMRSMILTLTR